MISSKGLQDAGVPLIKSPSSGLLGSSTKYNGGAASNTKNKRPTSGTLRKAALRTAGIEK
jgi:hypothetical protein